MLRSRFVKQASPSDLCENFDATFFTNSCLLGMSYLFLKICLLTSFESSAYFNQLLFLRVITIELINVSSSHDFSFLIFLSEIYLTSSLFTAGIRCSGTLRPFICIGFSGS